MLTYADVLLTYADICELGRELVPAAFRDAAGTRRYALGQGGTDFRITTGVCVCVCVCVCVFPNYYSATYAAVC
jgi:hypothetical protein